MSGKTLLWQRNEICDIGSVDVVSSGSKGDDGSSAGLSEEQIMSIVIASLTSPTEGKSGGAELTPTAEIAPKTTRSASVTPG
jgi:hypothetical protein